MAKWLFNTTISLDLNARIYVCFWQIRVAFFLNIRQWYHTYFFGVMVYKIQNRMKNTNHGEHDQNPQNLAIWRLP